MHSENQMKYSQTIKQKEKAPSTPAKPLYLPLDSNHHASKKVKVFQNQTVILRDDCVCSKITHPNN